MTERELADHAALLAAERRGRALAATLRPARGEAWRIQASADAAGAAGLVFARWVERFGGRAEVTPAPADGGDAPTWWRTLVESVRLLGLLAPASGAESVSGLRIRRGGAEATPELPDADVPWQATLAESSLFVREAGEWERLFTAEECRAVDRRAFAEFGVPGVCLMENAALDAAAVALDMLGGRRGSVLVACGGGNNGGDGLALARGLAGCGVGTAVALLKAPERLTGDAAVNFELLRRVPGVTMHILPKDFRGLLADRPLVVDALLGTGFKGAPDAVFAQTIAAINSSDAPVLALDLPSGLDADSGAAPGPVVCAERTLAFAGVKTGLVQGMGPEVSGRIAVGDIGAPSRVF